MDTTPYDGYMDTIPYDGYMDTIPYDGYMGTIPYDGYMDTIPYDGYMGTIPYDGYMDSPLYYSLRSLNCNTAYAVLGWADVREVPEGARNLEIVIDLVYPSCAHASKHSFHLRAANVSVFHIAELPVKWL